MLRAGRALRFTPDEIEDYRSLGLDFEGARTQDDVERALATWAGALADERPDLLNRIVAEMAKTRGVGLPAQFALVDDALSSSGSLRQS